MCLTIEAFATFLNLIIGTEFSTEPGRFIVHAQARDAHWVEVGDRWCTMAPQIDTMERLAALRLD